MRWVLAVLILLLGGMRVSAQSMTDADAAAAYESGNFAAAVTAYEALITVEGSTAARHTNLGSAYYQQGDLGRALLNYLRAYRLAPRDPAVSFGVSLVRAVRVDVQTEPHALLDNLAVFTEGVLTLGELSALTLAVWTLSFALGAGWLLRRALGRLRGLLIVVTGLSLLLLLLWGGRLVVDTHRPAAVVTAFEATAHSGPGDEYPTLFTLYAAAEVRVTGESEAWLRVALPDGRMGWLPVESVTRVTPDDRIRDDMQ